MPDTVGGGAGGGAFDVLSVLVSYPYRYML